MLSDKKPCYRVPDTPGSLFNFFQQCTNWYMYMSLEGKSQNSAVQNLCFMTRKKNRPTVGTGADRWQVKKKTVRQKL
jgi:hypothetical protein